MVGQTPGAISYVALSYVDTSKDIKDISIDGIEPTEANVVTNDYKVWSYEHMYTNTKKKQRRIKPSSNMFLKTTKTLKIRIYSISDMKVERDADGNITKK